MDGRPFQIRSGAIHYFRLHPDDWEHSLYNLKAMGFNTVETYIPWNMHEPHKDEFRITAETDFERFLGLASDLGLWAIVRPSPFICAEWEFGGLPAWLLAERGMRIRSNDPRFLERLALYYDMLMPHLAKHQITRGANIIMMQIENEYGSYCEDSDYMRSVRDLMVERGIDVKLCTSDGPWRACQRAGSLIEDNVLATGNFGSHATENFAALKGFHKEHGKTWPLMCMEFWAGWFNRWGESVVRRDPEELARSVREALREGSINLYMFHGGTNFGFMNGCSARHDHDLHQITSYDYDAPLDEAGNPTEKFYALQRMVREDFPDARTASPRIKGTLAPMTLERCGLAGLFETLDTLSEPLEMRHPAAMEDLGQAYGYILYRTRIEADTAGEERFRIVDARDRAQLFLNGRLVATQYQEDIGEDILAAPKPGINQLDILVENMGRVNYGHKLLASTQHKGIRTGICVDLHFVTGFEVFRLPLASADKVDFSRGWTPGAPAFHRFAAVVRDTALDTHLDLTGFGKGCVFVNGFNVGRFWEKGPTRSLYVPHGLLRVGSNDIIVFETEGIYSDELKLSSRPVIDERAGEER